MGVRARTGVDGVLARVGRDDEALLSSPTARFSCYTLTTHSRRQEGLVQWPESTV